MAHYGKKHKHFEEPPERPSPRDRTQPSQHADISPDKARKILRDGEVRGHPLTSSQRGMFGAIAGRSRKK